MISYKCDFKQIFSLKQFKKMRYPDILYFDSNFKVFINNELFYDDIYFPILEFIQYCLGWLENPQSDFVYNTIDNDDNPLLAFYKTIAGRKIDSVWKSFDCNHMFSEQEILVFINDVVRSIINDL